MRWIGTFTLPILAVLIVSYIGLVIANLPIPTPWHDPARGADGISLLGNSFICGIMFVLLTYHLAPKAKLLAAIVAVVLVLGFFVYCYSTLFSTLDKFAILRHVVFLASMIGTVVYLIKAKP